MYAHVYAHLCTRVYARLHVCMYACVHACVFACLHACMCTWVHACARSCLYARVHTSSRMCARRCINLTRCTHAALHTYKSAYMSLQAFSTCLYRRLSTCPQPRRYTCRKKAKKNSMCICACLRTCPPARRTFFFILKSAHMSMSVSVPASAHMFRRVRTHASTRMSAHKPHSQGQSAC